VLLWATWLAPQLVFSSFAGLFHRYYLEMMSPAIAAGAAIAIVLLWREYRRRGPAALLLPGALTASALVEVVIVSDFAGWSAWLSPLILSLVLGPALVLAALSLGPRRLLPLAPPALALALLSLLIAPAAWSVVTVWRGGDSGLPFAGPDLRARRPPGRLPINSPLLEYLTRNQGEERFLVATMNANTAAPIILATDKPVMALGGFSGGDPILSMEQLSRLVAVREVRFFYLPHPAGNAQRPSNQQMNLVSWVERTCRLVTLPVPRPGPPPPGPGTPGMPETNRLFDCKR
jgi:4-amino-4-deoxy-L-arabinose transferase-like glycosyltransferase